MPELELDPEICRSAAMKLKPLYFPFPSLFPLPPFPSLPFTILFAPVVYFLRVIICHKRIRDRNFDYVSVS